MPEAGSPDGPPDRAPRRAATAAGLLLLAVYAATAARDVTFWDAGEFLAAFATFGIPHPPGTPLYVALGRAWTLAAMPLGLDPAFAGALLSAACTAAAGAATAWLVARWTRSGACGLAAALCAGATSTAWANATEPEVYAAALALALAALVAGECAGGRAAGARGVAATAYALALAVPLHPSALVAAPAAAWLASTPPDARPARFDWTRAAALLSAAVLAVGAGTARPALAGLGGAGLVAAGVLAGRAGERRVPLAAAVATALALSATCILLVRARHDPWLNQGDPSTWARFAAVVGRRQYELAGLWPRQAPWWLQVANLGEWADWQFALGLAPGAEPAWRRAAVTTAYAALGVYGAAWHRRRDPRSWLAVLLVFGAGGLGVAAYLNLKAGPSFGYGVLPDAAPREARERDYFFVLAWWAWGLWAGVGCAAASRALWARFVPAESAEPRRTVAAEGVLLAALPLLLNWAAVSRVQPPAAGAAGAYARALLENAPPNAVLVVNGDNDTYPLWFAQAARGVRTDVAVVTESLLPARWYRAELARRTDLLPPDAVGAWLGDGPTLAAVADRAAARGRPVAVSLPTDAAMRAALARGPGAWVLRGLTLAWRPASAGASDAVPAVSLPAGVAARVGTATGDRAALEVAAARAPRVPPSWLADPTSDGVAAWAYRQLACPAAALAAAPLATAGRLEAPCRAR